MKQLFPRGKRIRPTDKDLVFHAALAALFPVFLLVVLLFHIRQIAGTNWQEVSLSQITQDVNIPYLLVSNHQFNWWFIISPPKGYCYCSPQRAVSQALLLARYKAVLLESSRLDSSACSFIYF